MSSLTVTSTVRACSAAVGAVLFAIVLLRSGMGGAVLVVTHSTAHGSGTCARRGWRA
jgi:hypothetical protein